MSGRRVILLRGAYGVKGRCDGWSVDSNALETNIRFVEDEDMRRTREARRKK